MYHTVFGFEVDAMNATRSQGAVCIYYNRLTKLKTLFICVFIHIFERIKFFYSLTVRCPLGI